VGTRGARPDFGGDRITYTLDAADRPVRKTFPDGSGVDYGYTPSGALGTATDARGLTRYAYDLRDRLTRVVHPDGESVDYAWDAKGNLVEVATAGGTLAYEYDALDRLVAVEGPGGRTEYEYDLAGNLVRTRRPNGVVTERSYDPRGRLLSLEHRDAGGALLDSFAYTLDPTGRREQVVEADGSLVSFGYDGRGRLVSETRTGHGPYAITYEYDAVGNRTRRVRDGVETLYAYDADDRLVGEAGAAFEYDADGNLTRSLRGGEERLFDWDFENRLVRVTGPAGVTDFEYDADGLLARRTDGGGSVALLQAARSPSGFAQVIEEVGAAGTRFHSHGLGFLGTTDAAGSRYAHRDGQHSIRLLTDAAGMPTDAYRYDAFGGLVSVAGATPNPYRYAGERLEEAAGTYYLRARRYDPDAGRFLGRDPFEGFDRDPTSQHPYLYAHADPVNGRDPSGRVTLIDLAVSSGFTATLRSVALEAALGLVNLNIAKTLGSKVLAPGARLYDEALAAFAPQSGDLLAIDVEPAPIGDLLRFTLRVNVRDRDGVFQLPQDLVLDTIEIARLGTSVGYFAVGFNLALPDLGVVGAFYTDPPLRRLARALQRRRDALGRLGLRPAPIGLVNAMDEAIEQWSGFCSAPALIAPDPGNWACTP